MSVKRFDRRKVLDNFLHSLINEPLIGGFLNLDEVGHFEHFLLRGIAHTHALAFACRVKPNFIAHQFTSFC